MEPTRDDPVPPAASPAPPPHIRFGLSAKLLVLTVLFVMLAEVCIYVPSIARFRLSWLENKLSAAYTAALVFDAAPDVPDELSRQILGSIGATVLSRTVCSISATRILASAPLVPIPALLTRP